MPADPSVLISAAQPANRFWTPPLELLRRLFGTRFGGMGVVIVIAITFLSVFGPVVRLDRAHGHRFAVAPAAVVAAPLRHRQPRPRRALGSALCRPLVAHDRLLRGPPWAFLIGGTIGALAGYFRGPLAAVLLRITDLFHTLPAIVIVLFSVSLLGASFWLQVAAVALAIWPIEARLMYGQFITLSEREFVLAARAAGLSTPHVIFKEILPNALPTVIVQVSLDASTAILIEAGLGFLGLSDPTVPSWGEMLNRGQEFLELAWWMSVFPGMAICIAVLGFNLLADGVTEMFNPRTSATAPKLEG